MAGMLRVKVRWSGWAGGPGFNVFHFRDFDGAGGEPSLAQAQSAVDRLSTWADGFNLYLPVGITIRPEADVEIIEDTTGNLVDVLNTVQPPAVAGEAENSQAGYSSAAGAVITWRTSGVRNNRRIRGRSFLVPLHSSAYQSDGTLNAGFIAALKTATDALTATASSPDLGVYARPTLPGAADGAWFVANSYSIPDMTAVLRSRRN